MSQAVLCENEEELNKQSELNSLNVDSLHLTVQTMGREAAKDCQTLPKHFVNCLVI